MIFFFRSAAFIFILFLSSLARADLRTIVNRDGSVDHFQLLPVKFDPAHRNIVQTRIGNSRSKLLGLPVAHTIPTGFLPPVRNQRSRGSCAYFSTIGILESFYISQGNSPRLSEECLLDVRDWMFDQGAKYTGIDKPMQRPDSDGDFPILISQTIEARGVPVAQNYSPHVNCVYDGNNVKGGKVSSDEYETVMGLVPNSASSFGKNLVFDKNRAPTIDQVKFLIASNIPVDVGVILFNEFLGQSNWIYDPEKDVEKTMAGGHAIILTGYSTQNGRTIFTFKNSWGTSWGNGGYGTLDEGLLKYSWGADPEYDFVLSL